MTIILILLGLVIGLIIYLAIKSENSVTKDDYVVPDEYYEIPSQLRFKPSWFSDDFVTPYFYHNGLWHALLGINRPMLENEDYEIENIAYRLGNGVFDAEKVKWATVGDCLKHNQQVHKELKLKRKERREDKLRREKQKIEAYKRANN